MTDPAQPRTLDIGGSEVTFNSIEQVQSIVEGLVETLNKFGAIDQTDRPENWLSETQDIADSIIQLCDFYDEWVADYQTFSANQEADLERQLRELKSPFAE
ncbi:MAG: hypothetical protein WA948_07070 [Pontixanthobacter sp.]